MRKHKIHMIMAFFYIGILSGCAESGVLDRDLVIERDGRYQQTETQENRETEAAKSESGVMETEAAESESGVMETEAVESKAGVQEPFSAEITSQKQPLTELAEESWSSYFHGLNGAAVVYDPAGGQYRIYNRELAMTRRSPCSTFKIISSLIALEHGIIDPEDSTRLWSGEVFWNEAWNQDMDFPGAFRESCVWYFRDIIDEIGQDLMKEELERLSYGNQDSSDWDGSQKSNNSNRALTGFWIESSLAISPREQTEVMERIFGTGSVYSEDTRNQLKQVMAVTGQSAPAIYGKTGMGKAHGVTVDAWFAGMAETEDRTLYFCVYLGETQGRQVSGAIAREIAVKILTE